MPNHFPEFAPVNFLDHAVRTFAEFLSEVLPVDSGNQKVERVYQGIDSRAQNAAHQIPVDVVYQAVEGLCKGRDEGGNLRPDIIPVDYVIQLLQAVIDA